MSSFAVTMAYAARQKIMLAIRLEAHEVLCAVADAGVRRAMSELFQDTDLTADAWTEVWANNEALFRESEVGRGRFSVKYPAVDPLTGKAGTRYGVEDEGGKLNLNRATTEELARLFGSTAGLSADGALDLAFCVIDWRDEDSFFGHPQYGAEDEYYQGLARPYTCKDAPFEVLEELLMVKGMDHEIFSRLSPYLTVHGDTPLNINTVPHEVLMAVGLSKEVADKIHLYRVGEDQKEGTTDDQTFATASGIVSALTQFLPFSSDEVAQVSNLVAAGRFGTSSGFFSVHCEAWIKSDPASRLQVHAVVERALTHEGKPTGRIKLWSEG